MLRMSIPSGTYRSRGWCWCGPGKRTHVPSSLIPKQLHTVCEGELPCPSKNQHLWFTLPFWIRSLFELERISRQGL